MKKVGAVLLAVLLCVPISSLQAFAKGTGVNLGGATRDNNGNPVGGVEIVVKASGGGVIARTLTDYKGGYLIEGLASGQYTLTLNPRLTGFKGQTVAAFVGPLGLTVHWKLETTIPAVALASNPGPSSGNPWGRPLSNREKLFAGGLILVGTFLGLCAGDVICDDDTDVKKIIVVASPSE